MDAHTYILKRFGQHPRVTLKRIRNGHTRSVSYLFSTLGVTDEDNDLIYAIRQSLRMWFPPVIEDNATRRIRSYTDVSAYRRAHLGSLKHQAHLERMKRDRESFNPAWAPVTSHDVRPDHAEYYDLYIRGRDEFTWK